MCDAKDIASFSAYLYKIDTASKSRRIGFRSSEPTFNMVRKSLDISKYLEGI